MLLESLLDSLVARQKDPCASVRRLVLRGLANIASGSPDKVRSAVWVLGLGMGVGGQRAAPWGRVCGTRGTAECGHCPPHPHQVQAHGPQLLTAVLGGLDDRDDPHSLVALEAMVGLARLLDLMEPQDLQPVLLHVAIRIRPFFDSVGWPGPRVPPTPRAPPL